MRFYDHETTRDVLLKAGRTSRKVSCDQCYKDIIQHIDLTRQSKGTVWQVVLEGFYEKTRRPYYNVYPSVVRLLSRLNLSAVPSKQLKLPLPTFCIRFPEGHRELLIAGQHPVRSILVGYSCILKGKHKDYDGGLTAYIDCGEVEESCGVRVPIFMYLNLPIDEGISLEDSSNALESDPSAFVGIQLDPETRLKIIRIIATVCLLENDPNIIEPDVLDRDSHLLPGIGDEDLNRLTKRAHNRGKIGWIIGRKIEMIPHVRGPSPFALYWTGHGRTIPKLRYRRGTIVHRSVVEKVPSGFQPQPEEKENK